MEIRVKIEEEDEPSRTRVCGTVACTRFLRDNRTKSGGEGSTIFFPFLVKKKKESRTSREEKVSDEGKKGLIGSNWKTRGD